MQRSARLFLAAAFLAGCSTRETPLTDEKRSDVPKSSVQEAPEGASSSSSSSPLANTKALAAPAPGKSLGIATIPNGGLGDGHFNAAAALSGIPNLYASISTTVAPGATQVVTAAPSAAPTAAGLTAHTAFVVGDLVMLHHTTGYTASVSGDTTPIDLDADPSGVGDYEFHRVVAVAGTTLTLDTSISSSVGYPSAVSQVVFVPEFTTVNIAAGATVIGRPWDGSKGGLTVFVASGAVTNAGTVSATGIGFRGAPGSDVNHALMIDSTPCYPAANAAGLLDGMCSAVLTRGGSRKGEGLDPAAYTSSTAGAPAIAYGMGNRNLGGGGGPGVEAPGGPGGHTTMGIAGGCLWDNAGGGGSPFTGYPGATVSHTSSLRAVFGGGAGEASNNGYQAAGGNGGGFVIVRAGSIAGAGKFAANGSDGARPALGDGADAAAGGGAGGTVVLSSPAAIACTKASADGGAGGIGNTFWSWSEDAAGGGGGDVIVDGVGGACAKSQAIGFTSARAAAPQCLAPIAAVCGNAHLDAGEGCDDGNTTNGDGCNSVCKIETKAVPRACNTKAPGATGNTSCASGHCDTTTYAAPGRCTLCGNGVIDDGEQCDDGGNVAGNGCSATCQIEAGYVCKNEPSTCAITCGDGVRGGAEACDDGNTTNGDGCSSTCAVELGFTCSHAAPIFITRNATTECSLPGTVLAANAVPGVSLGKNRIRFVGGVQDYQTAPDPNYYTLWAEYQIAAGATASLTGGTFLPTGTRTSAVTGAYALAPVNVVVGAFGLRIGAVDTNCNTNYDTTKTTWRIDALDTCVVTCGDGVLDATEGCDDHNLVNGDGCSSSCKKENGTACNTNAAGAVGNAGCASGLCVSNAIFPAPGKCQPVGTCGNGVLDAAEGCDDGNTAAGDGCSATCLVENGTACNATAPGKTSDASCASGVCDTAGNAAPGVCEAALACGNGKLEAGEGCDSGLPAGNATCSATCKIASGTACNGNASGATGNASCTSGLCNGAGGAPGLCANANTCGNGVLEAGEGCDSGLPAGNATCSATCKIASGTACNANAAGAVGGAGCASGVCDTKGNAAPGICEAALACGNGKLEAGEGCDSGLLAGNATCSATCKIATGTACNADAAGAVAGGSCTSGICNASGGQPGLCANANTCGNGVLEAGEGCDSGLPGGNAACSATCKIPDGTACNANASGATGNASCASGVCDTAGNAAPGVCEAALACGNGKLEAGEGCDSGLAAGNAACSATCKIPDGTACNANASGALGNTSCTSGICNAAGGAPGVCNAANACGNGVLEAGEGCDSGLPAGNATCSATCKIASGTACNANAAGAVGGAGCTSGICNAAAGAPGTCADANSCGNGVLEAGEGCDSGLLAGNATCNATCKIANGTACNANASGATGSPSCASGICNQAAGGAGVCNAANTCGNGVLEAGEGCDSGLAAGNATCSTTCKIPNGTACNASAPGVLGGASCTSGVCDVTGQAAPGVCEAALTCGNGVQEAGEACDDGGVVANDGCSASCKVETGSACNTNAVGPVSGAGCVGGVCDTVGNPAPGVCETQLTCGNGILEAGEGCDDGNVDANDGCSAFCKVEAGGACNTNASGDIGSVSCASGVCDTAGNAAPGRCENALACGNGKLEAGEGCDDGNGDPDDGCTALCKVEVGTACNANVAGNVGNASCATGICNVAGGGAGVCAPTDWCGNGKLEAGEGCDDGNLVVGDGCDGACTIEAGLPCNTVAPGAVGNASCGSRVCDTKGNAAPGLCEDALTCGNGNLEIGEGCDDGNTAVGDGCTAACKVETGGSCNDDANGAVGSTSCASGLCDTAGNAAPGVCEAVLTCGNGVLEAGEGCDDGNVAAGDGCTTTCAIETGANCNQDASGLVGAPSCASGICNATAGLPGICNAANTCGNNVLEAGEGCDDGNGAANDGCAATCKVEAGGGCNTNASGAVSDASCASGVCDVVGNGAPGLCEAALSCGNGKLEAGEGCDDGNVDGNDRCSALCKVEVGTKCNANAAGAVGNASCTSNVCNQAGGAPGFCAPANGCGNSVLEANEGCDDGNTNVGDGCDASCRIEEGVSCSQIAPGLLGSASCASGVCDTRGHAAPGVCEAAGTCGNGKLEATEGCDDGNTVAGDGCDALCSVENGGACNTDAAGALGNAGCASGVCDAVGNAAPGLCEALNACGNGVLEAGEGCDDGNVAANDGCTATCTVESGRACNSAAPGLVDGASCASGVCDTKGNAEPGVCEEAGRCGNGKLEANEGCDDGNTASNDGCTALCLVENEGPCSADPAGIPGAESCASGVCDVRGNGGSGQCEAALTCGNGKLEPGEGCDDGNAALGDGCTATCKIEEGNSCNDQAPGAVGNGSCLTGICNVAAGAPGICTASLTCGNSVVELGEGCDDGNKASGDGCDAGCKVENSKPCNGAGPGLVGSDSCVSGVCDTKGAQAPGVCEASLTCGNGKLEPGEGCDDGNVAAGDGCSATCLGEDNGACNGGPEGLVGNVGCASGLCNDVASQPGVCAPKNTCGNGLLEANEGCDDGNTKGGDGCASACVIEGGKPCNGASAGLLGDPSCESGVCNTASGLPGICAGANACGNGKLEAGEGGDDGNLVGNDGCDGSCKVETGSGCNAQAPGSTGSDSCASGVCNTASGAPGICAAGGTCGNGVLEAGEGCDDGNTAPKDGCSATCKIEDGQNCGAKAPGATGSASCESGLCNTAVGNPGLCAPAKTCGNGVLEAGEGCDDGNSVSGDGCALCKVEPGTACNANGAGTVGNESCTTGLCNTAAGAPGVCSTSLTCGNGTLEAGEGCDDGNTTSSDGCNAGCLVETGKTCGASASASCASTYCDSSNTCANKPSSEGGSLEGGSFTCATSSSARNEGAPFALFATLAALVLARTRKRHAA